MSRVLDRFKVAPERATFSEPDLNDEHIERLSDVVYDVVNSTVKVRGRTYTFAASTPGWNCGGGSLSRRHEAIPALVFAEKRAAKLGVRCFLRGYADDVGATINPRQAEKNALDYARQKERKRERSREWHATHDRVKSPPETVDTSNEESNDD